MALLKILCAPFLLFESLISKRLHNVLLQQNYQKGTMRTHSSPTTKATVPRHSRSAQILLGTLLLWQIVTSACAASSDSRGKTWDQLHCSGSIPLKGFIQDPGYYLDRPSSMQSESNMFYFVPLRDMIVDLDNQECDVTSKLYSALAEKPINKKKNIFTMINDPLNQFPACGTTSEGFKIFLKTVLTKISEESPNRRFLVGLYGKKHNHLYDNWGDDYVKEGFSRSDSEPGFKISNPIRESKIKSQLNVKFMILHPETKELPIADEIEEIKHSKNLTKSQRESDLEELIFGGEGCRLEIGADPVDDNDALKNFSKTSVLFVSVSFIILMVISLAWLVFYYVQRFRYAHAKDRLARRLFNAAKKALTKIPTRVLKQGETEIETDCPVCIEPYVSGDVIRVLPCKHVFHKTCVDPWLLEHRTCPMCKGDILKAFGYKFAQIEDSANGAGYDDGRVSVDGQSSDGQDSSSSVGGSYSAYPFPGNITDSDIHDPFFPSPAPSPSLVQQVMHPNSAAGFSIIPLTVHSTSISRPNVAPSQPTTSTNPVRTTLAGNAVHSDSSSEINEVGSPDTLLNAFKHHHSAEIHHPPTHGCDTNSTSATDSHGHSASCESSSDSDSCIAGSAAARNRAAAAPLLNSNRRSSHAAGHAKVTLGDQTVFQPSRTGPTTGKSDLAGQFQTRSRSAGNGPVSPPKKKSKAGVKVKRRQSAGATNGMGTVVPMVNTGVSATNESGSRSGTGKHGGKKDTVVTGTGSSSNPTKSSVAPKISAESRRESKGRFSAKRTSAPKNSVVIGTVSDIGSLESI